MIVHSIYAQAKEKNMLNIDNKSTLSNFRVGDNIIVSRTPFNPGSVCSWVDYKYGTVTGFTLDPDKRVLLLVKVIGDDMPQEIFDPRMVEKITQES